jgi:hypothetical protein
MIHETDHVHRNLPVVRVHESPEVADDLGVRGVRRALDDSLGIPAQRTSEPGAHSQGCINNQRRRRSRDYHADQDVS